MRDPLAGAIEPSYGPAGTDTDSRGMTRDAFINLLYEAGLSTILGPSIAFLPNEIPEGSKMSINSVITGIAPIATWHSGEIECGDPHYGFMNIEKDWGFTSKIDFAYSSFNDMWSSWQRLDRDELMTDYLGRRSSDSSEATPPTYYEIEEDGEQYYVSNDMIRDLMPMGPRSDADAAAAREFDNIFATIYLPSQYDNGGYTDAVTGKPTWDTMVLAPAWAPDTAAAISTTWTGTAVEAMSMEGWGGATYGGASPGVITGATPADTSPYAPDSPAPGGGSSGGGGSPATTTPPTGTTFSGVTAIAWTTWRDYLGLAQVGVTGPFSDASFVAYQQDTELINWYDTITGDMSLEAHGYLVNRAGDLESVGRGFSTSLGYGEGSGPGTTYYMRNVDENLILNYMDVSKVEPLGNTLGADRMNPKATSTIDEHYAEIDVFEGSSASYALVNVSTSDEAKIGLIERYKVSTNSRYRVDEWITAKSLEIEASLYASIATKLFAVKMQKALPLDNIQSIEGMRTPSSSTAGTLSTAPVSTAGNTIEPRKTMTSGPTALSPSHATMAPATTPGDY